MQAQEPINYSTKNGLPSNHVYDILQDEDGFIWFATNRGLVKYDGHSFRYFNHSDGLPNNDTWKLDLDTKGRLWYFSKSNRQGYIAKDSIYSFEVVDNKIISPEFFYDYGDFISIGYQKNVFQDCSFIAHRDKIHSEFYYHINKIISKKRYLALKENQVDLIDCELNVYKSFSIPEIKSKLKISSFLAENKYFVLYSKNWVILYNIQNETLCYLDLKQYGFSNRLIRIRFKNGEFQISTRGKLLVIDENCQILENYEFEDSLDGIFAFKDSENNVWVNSLKNGVYLFSNQQNQANYYLKNEKITMLGYIQDQLVAATEASQVYFYNNEHKQFEKKEKLSKKEGRAYLSRIYGKKNYLVKQNAIYEISEDKILKKNYSELNKIVSGGKDFVQFNGYNYVIGSAYIKNMTTNNLIHANGLFRGEIYNQQFIISSSLGLVELKNEKVKPYVTDYSELNKIPTISLLAKGKHLLVGTDGRGLFIVQGKHARQIKFTENTSIYKIMLHDGFIWLGTNDGIKKISFTDNFEELSLVDQFFENDGFLQNQINDFTIYENQLWVANDIGVTSILPNGHYFKRPVLLYLKHLEDSLYVAPQGNRNLTVGFGAVDYSNQNRFKYFTRLLPKDTVWKDINAREIVFNDLKPGQYKFQVKAYDQHFNLGEKTLQIQVQPKWWERKGTIIFFILAGLGLLSLLLVITLKYQHRKKIEKIERNRSLKRLELQALRAQMNPHFVHNSLNSILYYIQVTDVKKSEEYLTRFSVLIRLFFEYSRQKLIPLSSEIKLIKNYLEIEKLRFEDKINYSIHTDEQLNLEERQIPSLLLQPIVENSVNHGLFHKKTDGRVQVHFHYIDDISYKVIIDDDGIGYEKTKEIYSRSVKKYSSRSGEVLTERLKLLKEARDWNIDYKIVDKSTEGNEGTRVEIIFTRIYN